jgi:D-alanyl-lipoteichoic acid acyltransferase DltB (MBOAT superfamily)
VGLSFIFFRQIHFVVDVRQGEIRDVDLWAYLVYQLNPFTLLAGPIQRFQRFYEDWGSLAPLPKDGHEVRMAIFRILVGVIKVSAIADIAFWIAYHPPASMPALQYPILLYFFAAYVYFNFAGYCDIVIAGASLVGLRVPENFDKPYLARNMIDFWTRWHRTLSFWIRDYIFTPLYMTIARSQPALAPKVAFLCYFVALFLAGVWHGASWNFVIFGLLNGLGVSAAKLWENIIIARFGRQALKTYLANQPIKWAARIATLHFVCLTMVFLRPGSAGTLGDLLGPLLARLGVN